MTKDRISGEGGLSHLLYQQVGGIVNQVLNAIGRPGAWNIRARGSAPVEDWRLVDSKQKTRAVLELKTPDALTSNKVTNILTMIREDRFEMVPLKSVNKAATTTTTSDIPDETPSPLQPAEATTAIASAAEPSVPMVISLRDTNDKGNTRQARSGEVRMMEQVRWSWKVFADDR